jgi:hypothetical protein
MSQKTAFFIVTAVKTSDLTPNVLELCYYSFAHAPTDNNTYDADNNNSCEVLEQAF